MSETAATTCVTGAADFTRWTTVADGFRIGLGLAQGKQLPMAAAGSVEGTARRMTTVMGAPHPPAHADRMTRSSTLLKIAVAAALPVLAVGFTVQRHIDTRADEMARGLDLLGAARRAADTDREAVYGETVDGPAWPHYEFALTETKRLCDKYGIHNDNAVEARTPEERAERDVLLVNFAPVFEALHRGAHARDARMGMDPAEGGWNGVGLMVSGFRLSALGVAKAKGHFERGEDLPGVDALLDVQQLGRDFLVAPSHIESMMGLVLLGDFNLLAWFAEGGAGQMSVEAKERLLDGLDRIRASIPAQRPAWAGELERFGRGLQRTVQPVAPSGTRIRSEGWMGPSSGPGLAYGFSWRVAGADLLERGPDFVRREAAAHGATNAATQAALRDLQAEMERDENPLIGYFGRHIVTVGESHMHCMARADFLRYALAVHLGREAELPADPWGRGVNVEVDGDHVRIWTKRGDGLGLLDVVVCNDPR